MRVRLVAALLAVLAPGPAAAADRGADPPALTLPAAAEVLPLAPWLDRRELLILESSPDGSAAQTTAVSVFPLPVDEVLAALGDPANFKIISRNLVRVEPAASGTGGCTEYEWEVEVPFFNLEGRNRLCVDGVARTVRIHTVRGEVVPSGALWRLHPLDGGKTLVVFASFSDVARVSWFLARMIEEDPIKEQAMVAESGFSTLRGVKTFLAERGAHAGDATWRVEQSGALVGRPELGDAFDSRTAIPLERLRPLLGRGEVAVFRYSGAGVRAPLEQVTVYGEVRARAESVTGWVDEPRRWMGLIPDLLRVEPLCEKKKASERRFRMTYGYSVMTFEVEAVAVTGAPGWALKIRLLGGDLGNGVMGWQVRAVGPKRCVVASSRLTDAMQGSVILRQMAAGNPLARQSLNMNRGFLAVRAIKLAAEKVARYGL